MKEPRETRFSLNRFLGSEEKEFQMAKDRATRSGQAVGAEASVIQQQAAARQQATGQFKDDPLLGAAAKAVAAGDLDRARTLERQDEAARKAQYGRQVYPGRKGTA